MAVETHPDAPAVVYEDRGGVLVCTFAGLVEGVPVVSFFGVRESSELAGEEWMEVLGSHRRDAVVRAVGLDVDGAEVTVRLEGGGGGHSRQVSGQFVGREPMGELHRVEYELPVLGGLAGVL